MKSRVAMHMALGLLACASLRAQSPGTCDLRGEVQESGGLEHEAATVELADLRGLRPYEQVRLNFDNTFYVHNVVCGEYMLRVLNNSGQLLKQDYVTLHPDNFPLTIRLDRRKVNRPAEGAVSVARLREPVPKKAYHAFLSAQKYTQKGQYPRAAAELEKAVQLYPKYTEAYTNLGVEYIRMQQPLKALEPLHKAIGIGPPAAIQYGNLAFALWVLGRCPEAETAARHALLLDGGYRQAHYLLGVVLARDQRTSTEATQHLQFAAQEFPNARLNLAQVYAQEGRRDAALKELKEYRRGASPDTQGMVERWISQLQAPGKR